MNIRFEQNISDLHRKVYEFLVLTDYGDKPQFRLVRYMEQTRETTRKRIWTNVQWFDTYEHNRRFSDTFIAGADVEIPQFIKDAVIKEFISRIIFTRGS